MRSDIEYCKAVGFDVISTFACFLGKDYEDLYGEVDITPFAKSVFGKSKGIKLNRKTQKHE